MSLLLAGEWKITESEQEDQRRRVRRQQRWRQSSRSESDIDALSRRFYPDMNLQILQNMSELPKSNNICSLQILVCVSVSSTHHFICVPLNIDDILDYICVGVS